MIPYFSINTIDLGPVTINFWGVFISVGFLVAYFLGRKRVVNRKKLMKADQYVDMVFMIFISGIIGARILWLLENFSLVRKSPSLIYKIWEGGLSVYGGFILSLIFFYFYTKRKKLKKRKILENLVFPVTVGLILGWFGSFMVMNHFGKVSYLPWAREDPFSMTRHPIALYMMISHSLFLGLLYFAKKKKIRIRKRYAFVIYYPVCRLIVDFFREKKGIFSEPNYKGVTTAQFISIGVLLILVAWNYFLKNKKKNVKKINRRRKKKRRKK